jgi:hypothetical protein
MDDSESNFITLQGILTHTLGNLTFRATVPILFRGVDQGHHKRMQDHTHIHYAGRMPTSRLYGYTVVHYAEHIPTRRCVCITKTKIRVVG